AAGDPLRTTFTRSTLKPFQALPFVAAGGIARFALTVPETALLCASHSGEPRHVELAASILAKAGNNPGDLQCGTHAPGYFEVRGEVPPPPPYSPLAHNCSGKHAGMLAQCTACGYAKAGYLDPAQPLQREVRRAVAAATGVDEAAMPAGTDGCSLPNYAVPLASLALAYARLAAGSALAGYGEALAILARAMIAHPEMVSGAGRSDLLLAQAGRGDWVAKIGAEGVQALGIASRGVGIAIKLDDGARRALLPVTIATLAQGGYLDAAADAALAAHAAPALRNYRGTVTGEIRPIVVLDNLGGQPGAFPPPAARGAPPLRNQANE
ncbi:MAG: asparaginase, partial [Burkholderiales bacterium]|nr:asparaginase [Burkholderiales bacterium]